MARTRSLIIAADGDLIVERDPGRSTGRLLRQDDMDASYVDLADARHLEFDYLRWTRLLLRSFGAHRVVHVGGAACTLARALVSEDATSRHEVIELDQRVFDFARAHLGLRREPGLRLRIGDGRRELELRADNSLDAVVIDAFLGARVPRHLVTGEASAEYARVASLTTVNVVDTPGWPDARAIAAGLSAAYNHIGAVSAGGRRCGNLVLFGSVKEPDYRLIEGYIAADRSPARLLRASDLEGAPAWRD